MEQNHSMCKFYKRDVKLADRFYCTSPGNHHGENRMYCSSGAERPLFNYCRSADSAGCQSNCGRFVTESIPVMKSEVPDAGQLVSGTVPVIARQPVSGTVPVIARQPVSGAVSSKYTFVPEIGMCKYWQRDESDGKKYHCHSNGNGEGPEAVFESTGREPSVERFRSHCRRPDKKGRRPACDFYIENDSDQETKSGAESELDAGKIIKPVLKAGLKAAVNPAGIAGEIISGIIDEI